MAGRFQKFAARAVPQTRATSRIQSHARFVAGRPASIQRCATAKAAMKYGNARRCGCRSAWKNVKNGNSLIVLNCSGPMTREACQ